AQSLPAAFCLSLFVTFVTVCIRLDRTQCLSIFFPAFDPAKSEHSLTADIFFSVGKPPFTKGSGDYPLFCPQADEGLSLLLCLKEMALCLCSRSTRHGLDPVCASGCLGC
ncbi:unnamed protein product, partial [Discosporangium mesarthrocarpum]